VYTDRAEVTRRVTVQLQTSGIQEITISGFSDQINTHSLRVAGVEGGNVVILEVSHGIVYPDLTKKQDEKPGDKQKHEQPAEQEKKFADQISKVSSDIALCETELAWLKSYTGKQQLPYIKSEGSSYKESLINFENVENLLKFHRKNAERIQFEMIDLVAQRQELHDKRAAVQTFLGSLGNPTYQSPTHDVTITFGAVLASSASSSSAATLASSTAAPTSSASSAAPEPSSAPPPVATTSETITLSLCYVITGARWTPAYDVRVETDKQQEEKEAEKEAGKEKEKEKEGGKEGEKEAGKEGEKEGGKEGGKGGKDSCELVYYGVINNQTGEDWKNVKISLSTASPSLGGVPPVLPPIKLQHHAPFRNFLSGTSGYESVEDNYSDSDSGSYDEDEHEEKERMTDRKGGKEKDKKKEKKKSIGRKAPM